MNRRIVYIQYANPAAYPPVEHSASILAGAGWQIFILAIESLSTGDLQFHESLIAKVRQLSAPPTGWRQKLYYLWFVGWVIFWIVRLRPSWIYVSDALACPVALLLSYLSHVKIIYHEHDSPSVTTENTDSIFIRWVLWARRHLARRADLCILPNEQRARVFGEIAGRKAITVWNCPTTHEVSEPRLPHTGSTLRLLYHGSIGPGLLPQTALEALVQLPSEVSLTVIGYERVSHVSYLEQLRCLTRQLGLEQRVTFLRAMPRFKLLEQCKMYDVGLALMPDDISNINMRHLVGASNKAFDYLACGLALLVSDLPDWHELYVAPGYGLACNPSDPDNIAEAVNWFLEHPDQMRHMGEQGRQRILREWNYERQFWPVLEQLEIESRSQLG